MINQNMNGAGRFSGPLERKKMIQNVDHITINVKNLKESLYFYHDILEMPLLETIDMGDHSLTYLQCPNKLKLELISYMDDTGEAKIKNTERGSYRHIAYEVTKIGQLYEKLVQSGTVILMEPAYIDKLASIRMLAADPNGVELEFIQY
ncbi:MAG: VOC family protein [Eubacteriales bacterium]|nr:VOC family protein [Eubacteriales bacterium]